MTPPETINCAAAGIILGYTARRIRTLAAAGKIPGAYRLDEHSQWRFIEVRVRAYRRHREAIQCQISIEEEEATGVAFGGERTSRGAFEREIGLLRSSG